jgi:streptomycin 6-kinase
VIDIPDGLVATQIKFNGAAGRAFIDGLPGRAAHFPERWGLRVDGPSMCGVCVLVLPVVRAAGRLPCSRCSSWTTESEGEPLALRVWGGDGVVRLFEHDAETGTLLLERPAALRPGAR